MTISAYVQTMAGKFGIVLDETEMNALFIDLDIEENEEYTKTSSVKAKTALVSIFSQLLLSPKTIKEGNMTITQADKDAILAYCSKICADAGIDNPFDTSKDTIINMSGIW